jgi:hypothetical protein
LGTNHTHLRAVAHVAHGGAHQDALAGERGLSVGQRRGVDVGQEHARPGAAQRLRARQPYSFGAARHQRNLALDAGHLAGGNWG